MGEEKQGVNGRLEKLPVTFSRPGLFRGTTMTNANLPAPLLPAARCSSTATVRSSSRCGSTARRSGSPRPAWRNCSKQRAQHQHPYP